MSTEHNKHSTGSTRKSNGKFHSKHIKHDPQAESARATFGFYGENNGTSFGFHNRNAENKK